MAPRIGSAPSPSLPRIGGDDSIPAPVPTPTPAPTTVSPFAAVVQDTFTRLGGDVSGGKLSAADAQVLSQATGQLGVIGEAEALRAAHTAEQLPAADRATFQAAVDGASSDTARAFLYKALAAGHTVAEVQDFAQQIQGWGDDKLVGTLSLADDLGGDSGMQDGVKQQFEASCVATTAQALRGECDPIYALAVRTQNTNINLADDNDAFAENASLAKEQKSLLENVGGGVATARNDYNGAGVVDEKLADVFNAVSDYTGFTYSSVFSANVTDPAQADVLCDGMAKQLQAGIPTPLKVTSDDNWGGHAVLACAVEGSGADQKFLIHDPWEGTTTWVTRTQIEQGTFSLAGWNRLGAYEAVSPSALPS